MDTIQLTEGAIEALFNNDIQVKPVLQVTEIRPINSQTSVTTSERFRIVLSDGVYCHQAMLATQHNGLVKNGLLLQGSVIRLLEFVCNKVQERRIIIMADLEVIQQACDEIGQPTQYIPPNSGSVPSSVGQPRAVPVLNYQGKTYATQPKAEYGAPMQSYGTPSAINQNSGRYSVNNGTPMHSKSEFSANVSGNATGGGFYGGFNNTRTAVSHAPPSSYGRNPQPAYQQQPSMYMNRGPIAKNEAPPRIVPIAALNPYQGRWTIKARVTAKGELRHYNNPRGDGKVFSFDLLDSDGGEIRATCFNAVADQFYDLIEVGKVYEISKGTLKPAQKNFNHLPNDHEITLDTTSIVQPCYDNDSNIPTLQFRFRPISDIENMDNQSVIDVIGVVSSICPTASIMRKNGTTAQKRSLQLKDMSGKSVKLTLWGNFCNAEGQALQNLCDTGNFPVLAVKTAKISDFNGKALGTISTSQLFIEPDNPEAQELKSWLNQEGKSLPSISISREITSMGRTDIRKNISQIMDEKLGTSEKPDWITICATLSFMKMDNFCYTACPIQIGDRQCNKKVTNNGEGKWHCDKCDQAVDECDYRYILQIQIQDHSGLTWATAFQECGEELLGVSAKELFKLKYEMPDDEKFQETVRAALFNKYIFKLKVKEETFSDESRIKSTVVKAERVNFGAESRFLSELIHNSSVPGRTEIALPNISPNKSGNNYCQTNVPGMNYGMIPNSNSRETGGFSDTTSQYGNQYSGGYGGGVASSTYATCHSCGSSGHSSTNCPSIINSPRQPSRPTIQQPVPVSYTGNSTVQCYKCRNVGHFAKDCPGVSSVVPQAYGGSNVVPGRYGSVQRQHVGGF